MEVHEPYIIVHPDTNGLTGFIVLDGECEKWMWDCEKWEEMVDDEMMVEEGRGGRSSFLSHRHDYSSFGRGGRGWW